MKRAYVVNQADLRMDGNLAMNVKRVLPVTQADVATAAQQGIFWNVKRYEVVNTLDNLRGGTQRILKVNAAAPGVQRAFLTSATTIVTVLGVPPLVLPDAVEGDLVSLKAFGGTEQGLPAGYTALTYIENSATTLVPLGVSFGTSNFKMEITAVVQNGSLNLFQSQTSGGLTRGIGGSSANTIYGKAGSLNDVSITANNYRTAGHKYTIAFTAESGTGTLKVDDLTASTTETVTGTYTTGVDSTEQICLFGNTQAQYVGAGTQIFGAKLWKDGALVLDLVPSRQGATKGFFDLVSRTFKTASTGTLLAGADTTLAPTPDAPMDIICNNGVLKFGKPVTIDSTRYYAYLAANLIEWTYSGDSYTIVVPVTVGGKYKITVPTTTPLNGLQNTIFRWGFTDTINTNWQNSNLTGQTSITSYDTVRTTPQDTPSVEVTATHPYMIIQMGAAVFNYIIANNLITITDQSIYTDGTVETINVHGKNLFDKTTYIAGKYYNSSGNIVENPNYGMSDFIPMKSGQTFALSGRTPSGIALFNTSQVWQQQVIGQSFTAPYDGYFVVSLAAGEQDTLQVERGSTATDYVPYFDGGTATCEDLLSVGTYTDEQEVISGGVTRKVGVAVLDGTENIGKSSQYAGSFFVRNVVQDWGTSNNAQVFCSHFSCITAESSYAQNKCMILNNAFNMWWASDNTPTVAQFQQWLADQYAAGTPVIVIYPLATSTTETVTGQPMSTTQGDNTVEITQASMSGLELEATYNAGVVLTVEEVEDAQLSPDVEVTIQ